MYGRSLPSSSGSVFGADCVVHLPVSDRENKSKLDAAGVPAKYLGVPPNNAGGYLVYIPSKNAVFVRRNVLFQEDMERVRGPLMDKTSLRKRSFPTAKSGTSTPNSAKRSSSDSDSSSLSSSSSDSDSDEPPTKTEEDDSDSDTGLSLSGSGPEPDHDGSEGNESDATAEQRRRRKDEERSGGPRVRQRLRLRLPRDVRQPVLRRREPHR